MNLVLALSLIIMAGAAVVLFMVESRRTSTEAGSRSIWVQVLFPATYLCLLVVTIRSFATSKWFEDDAMITLRYSRNLVSGCGWNFNCGGNDFATSSYLQTIVGSIWFFFFDNLNALQAEKIWEVFLVVVGSIAFVVGARWHNVSRSVTVVGLSVILLSRNSLLYLFSGMENALAFGLLALLFLAYTLESYKSVGVLVGLCTLTRPEYALAGLVLAFLDMSTPPVTPIRPFNRLRRWSVSGGIAVATWIPVAAVLTWSKGSPFAQTLDIKRLTASNWGATYTDGVVQFILGTGFGLGFIVLGAVGLLISRSALLFWPIFAVLILGLYHFLGLPNSPWYYTTFWLGISGSLLGLPAFLRQLYSTWLPTGRVGQARSAVGSLVVGVALTATLFGNPFVVAGENKDFANRLAAKRQDINAELGSYLASILPEEGRVAVPNIGYVGFYSNRFVVDLVGLVTPDASLATSSSNWRQYQPEVYTDKAKIAERLLSIDGYRFLRVVGSRQHKGERFLVLVDEGFKGSAHGALLSPLERDVLGDEVLVRASLLVGVGDSTVSPTSDQFYISFLPTDTECNEVKFRLSDADGSALSSKSYYETRDEYLVADVDSFGDMRQLDWSSTLSVEVSCMGGGVVSVEDELVFAFGG